MVLHHQGARANKDAGYPEDHHHLRGGLNQLHHHHLPHDVDRVEVLSPQPFPVSRWRIKEESDRAGGDQAQQQCLRDGGSTGATQVVLDYHQDHQGARDGTLLQGLHV